MSNERCQLLYDIARALLLADDPVRFLDEIYPKLADHLGLEIYFHFAADPSGRLRLATCAGVTATVAEQLEWLDYGQAVCGEVARSRKPIAATDIQHDDDPSVQLVRKLGISCYVCHPLICDGNLLGTLSFGSRRVTHFPDDAVDLMRTVCDMVALAIARKQDRDALAEANVGLERRVERRTQQLDRRNQQLRQLARELTLVEQRERKRLAYVLHDELQQLLVAARMYIQPADEGDGTSRQSRAADLIGDAIALSRGLTRQLSPPVLFEGSLSEALGSLASDMHERHGLTIDVRSHLDPEPALAEDVRVTLFQAARELLFNVVKHAKVDHAAVVLEQAEASMLRLTVKDHGNGFDADALLSEDGPRLGFGITHLRQRLEMLGGTMRLTAAPGSGCRVQLEVPVAAETDEDGARDRPHAIERDSVLQ